MFLPTTFLSILLATSTFYPKQRQDNIERLADVTNQLGDRLQHLSIRKPGNQVVSPYGVSVILNALYQGAGVNEKQLHNIEYKQLEKKLFDISETQKFLRRLLQQDSQENQFEEANVVLYPTEFLLSQQYKQQLRSFYDALVQNVDYEEELREVARKVNLWVERQTNGKILHMVDEDEIDTSSGLAVLNGIYYKGLLDIPSQKKLIRQQPFYYQQQHLTRLVTTIEAETKLPYYQDEKIKAVEIPFKGEEMKMLVILPSQEFGVKEIQEQLTHDKIKQIRNNFQELLVKLSIPEFRIKSSHHLDRDIGIASLPGSDAEFSEIISDTKVRVSKIVQKNVIEVTMDSELVDEYEMVKVIDDQFGVEFKVNRPFLFYIIHQQSGLHLLTGRVMEL